MVDISIIGGGPAGLAAGIYAVRGGVKAVLFEGLFPGGQAASIPSIENYPGFPDGISGAELSMLLEEHARKLGLEIINEAVNALSLEEPEKVILTPKGEYASSAVILCTGSSPKTLGLPGEERLKGRGISYCATCDGAFFKGKQVAVAGGGNTALTDAIFLAKLAQKVYIIHRRDQFRAENYLVESAKRFDNIEFVYSSTVAGLHGDDALEGIALNDLKTGEATDLDAQGLFVAIGATPNTELFGDQLELRGGYVKTDANMMTSISGVYAAGDVRDTPLRQIITAMADGAVAASHAVQLLGLQKSI